MLQRGVEMYGEHIGRAVDHLRRIVKRPIRRKGTRQSYRKTAFQAVEAFSARP